MSTAIWQNLLSIQDATRDVERSYFRLNSLAEPIAIIKALSELDSMEEKNLENRSEIAKRKWLDFTEKKGPPPGGRDVRCLCWEPTIAVSKNFQSLLKSQKEIRSLALRGLLASYHLSWAKLDKSDHFFFEAFLRRGLKETGSKSLGRLVPDLSLLLGEKAVEKFSELIGYGEHGVQDLCEKYSIVESSSFVASSVVLAAVKLIGVFEKQRSHQRRVFIREILGWRYLEKGVLKLLLAKILATSALDSDEENRKNIIDLVMRLPELGDPRVYPHHWEDVSEKSRANLLKWLSVEDIEIFFNVIFAGAKDPHQRKPFWLSYAKYIQVSRVFVCEEDRKLCREPLRKLEEEGRRFGKADGFTSAFVMDLGNVVIVEFKEVGNACYVYEKADFFKLVKSFFQERVYPDRLKSQKTAAERFRHTQNWQEKVRRWIFNRTHIWPS